MSVPDNRFIVKFQRLTRLLDLPSLTSFSAEETTQLVLGNPSPTILQKGPTDMDTGSHRAPPML